MYHTIHGCFSKTPDNTTTSVGSGWFPASSGQLFCQTHDLVLYIGLAPRELWENNPSILHITVCISTTSGSRALNFHHCCPFAYPINSRSRPLSRLARFLRAPKLRYRGAFVALAFQLSRYGVAFQAANAAAWSTLLLPGCGCEVMTFSMSRARLRLKVHSRCASADSETGGAAG